MGKSSQNENINPETAVMAVPSISERENIPTSE